jgi:acetyltransferase-like isoleucine patch superfamily enzyme
VAARATVERSVVGPGATVGQRCTVLGVSVIGADVVVPAGTELEGARVPEGA